MNVFLNWYLTNIFILLIIVTWMPTVPTPKDHSIARVIRGTPEMESTVLVKWTFTRWSSTSLQQIHIPFNNVQLTKYLLLPCFTAIRNWNSSVRDPSSFTCHSKPQFIQKKYSWFFMVFRNAAEFALSPLYPPFQKRPDRVQCFILMPVRW